MCVADFVLKRHKSDIMSSFTVSTLSSSLSRSLSLTLSLSFLPSPAYIYTLNSVYTCGGKVRRERERDTEKEGGG